MSLKKNQGRHKLVYTEMWRGHGNFSLSKQLSKIKWMSNCKSWSPYNLLTKNIFGDTGHDDQGETLASTESQAGWLLDSAGPVQGQSLLTLFIFYMKKVEACSLKKLYQRLTNLPPSFNFHVLAVSISSELLKQEISWYVNFLGKTHAR